MRTLIAVVGSGGTIDESALGAARDVGFELGRRGVSLVCGGLGGVMEAACEGLRTAREHYATDCLAVGILPGEEAGQANPFVDLALPSGLGLARNTLVARAGAALIVVAGEAGTLSEVALAWQLGKPIVALAPTGGVAGRLAGQALDERRHDVIVPAQTPAEAVDLALKAR
jgi:uncharacterized protein (TIGR00725 family)